MIRTNKVQFDCLKFIERWQTVQEISRATDRAVNSCTMTMTTLIAQGRAESRIVPNEDRSHGAPYKTKAYRRTQAGTEAVAAFETWVPQRGLKKAVVKPPERTGTNPFEWRTYAQPVPLKVEARVNMRRPKSEDSKLKNYEI